jgi:hypothetical protein
LTLRAAAFAESFLRIFQELVPLHEGRRPPVENVEEDDEFGTDARNRTELSELQG